MNPTTPIPPDGFEILPPEFLREHGAQEDMQSFCPEYPDTGWLQTVYQTGSKLSENDLIDCFYAAPIGTMARHTQPEASHKDWCFLFAGERCNCKPEASAESSTKPESEVTPCLIQTTPRACNAAAGESNPPSVAATCPMCEGLGVRMTTHGTLWTCGCQTSTVAGLKDCAENQSSLTAEESKVLNENFFELSHPVAQPAPETPTPEDCAFCKGTGHYCGPNDREQLQSDLDAALSREASYRGALVRANERLHLICGTYMAIAHGNPESDFYQAVNEMGDDMTAVNTALAAPVPTIVAELRREVQELRRIKKAIEEKGGTEYYPTESAYLAVCESNRRHTEGERKAIAERDELRAKLAEAEENLSLKTANLAHADSKIEEMQAFISGQDIRLAAAREDSARLDAAERLRLAVIPCYGRNPGMGSGLSAPFEGFVCDSQDHEPKPLRSAIDAALAAGEGK